MVIPAPMAGPDTRPAHPPPPVEPPSSGRNESPEGSLRLNTPRTFASLVSTSRLAPRFPPMKLSSRQVGTKDGKPSVSFSATEFAAGAKRFEFSLVAKFSVGRPPVSEIQKAFQTCWKITGRATISEIWDPRHVLIILDSEADVTSALACPLRKIGHSMFRLFRWTTDYNHRTESKMTTAWIKLPGLPLPLYEKCFLDVMVSTFGRLLDVDERTKACNALRQLHACIEVDVTKHIPSEIWVNLPNNQGFWQPVELETRLSYCSDCKKHGHSVEDCRKAAHKREKKKNQAKSDEQFIQKNANVVQVSRKGTDAHKLKKSDGWVQVTHRKTARLGKPTMVESTRKESYQGQGIETLTNSETVHNTPDKEDDEALAVVEVQDEYNDQPLVQSASLSEDNMIDKNNAYKSGGMGGSRQQASQHVKEIVHSEQQPQQVLLSNPADITLVDHNVQDVDQNVNLIDNSPLRTEEHNEEMQSCEDNEVDESLAWVVIKGDDGRFSCEEFGSKSFQDLEELGKYAKDNGYALQKESPIDDSGKEYEVQEAIHNSAIESCDQVDHVDSSPLTRNRHRKKKGSLASARTCPKKKDSNFVWS